MLACATGPSTGKRCIQSSGWDVRDRMITKRNVWQFAGNDFCWLSLDASANLETHMPLGTLAIRENEKNPTHHLYRNGNLWWVHFFVHHSGFKAKRVRLSLKTSSIREAIERRDDLFEEVRQNGFSIPDKTTISPTSRKNSPIIFEANRPTEASQHLARCEGGLS